MAEYGTIGTAPRASHYLRIGGIGTVWQETSFDTLDEAFATALGTYLLHPGEKVWIVYFDPHQAYGEHWLSQGVWTPPHQYAGKTC